MPTSVTLSGWKEFEQKAKNMPSIIQSEITGEAEDAARLWADLAKRDAPVDQGFLRGLISSRLVAPMHAETTSAAEHSAWMEWGTKTKVRVPADLQAYAQQFRAKGSGNAKQMIYAWMKRVGVPPEFQYRVFLSIIIKGINPHPYFFIQVPLVEKQLFTNVGKIINTEH